MSWYSDYVFPFLLAKVSKKLDPERAAILPFAKGRVLEIGVGTGANFSFYPQDNDLQVYGLEPDINLLARAQEAADDRSQQDIQLIAGDALCLPFANGSMDTVVCCLVLCTVPNPQQVMAEVKRVLKPNGQLLVFEHVAAHSTHTRLAKWQNRLNPIWTKFACGCELNRPTRYTIEAAGFVFDSIQDERFQRYPALVSPMILGVAHPHP